MGTTAFGALDYGATYYKAHWTGQFNDSVSNPIYLALDEISDELDSIVAGTADTLDATYNAGSTIDVDTDAVTLTVSDTDNNAALILVQNDSSNNPDALQITNAGTGDAISINGSSTGNLIYDEDGNFTVSSAGLVTAVGLTSTGEIQTTADVLFNGTYDAAWDVNRNQFIFQDNAVLGIGGAHDAAADVAITWDADSLNIVPVAADTLLEIGDSSSSTTGFDIHYYFETAGELLTDYDGDFINLTDDMDLRFGTGASANGDFMISGDSAPLLTIDVVVAGTGEIAIGNDADDVPLKWFGETTGGYFYFTGDQLQGVGAAQVSLNDDVELLIGTGVTGAGDFQISGTSAPALVIDVVVAGSGSIEIGNDADDVPLTWFGETTGNYIKMTGDQLQIEGGATGAQLALGDGDAILFGDTLGTGDFSISDETDVLVINNVVDGTGTVAFGIADTGLDVAFYGDAGSGVMLWDENANTNGALVFDNADIEMGDGDFVQFGDGADLTVSATGTTTTVTMAAGSDLDILDTDDALSKILIGTVGGTHGLDVTLNGVTAGNIMAFDAGAETFTLTDVDLNLVAPDVTDVAMTATAGGANTASLVVVDGATGAAAWAGAATTGMVHLSSDGALVADGSLLRIASSGNISAANDGALLELVESGAAQATSYAMRIASTNNEAIHVDSGKVLIDESLIATLGIQVGVGETLEAAAAEGAGQTIDDGVTVANVTSVASAATDFITLPNEPSIGTVVKVLCNAGSNFEIRTLTAGNDTINGVDTSDGGTEYLATDTDMIIFTCINADTWQAVSYAAAGGVRAAVTPD
jgi:hypothetical protein